MTKTMPSGAPEVKLRRRADLIRFVSIALLVVGVLLLMGALPVKQGVDRMESWIRGLGLLGPIVYGGIYILAVILMIPGSALSLPAGAIFGLVEGTVLVSIASTTGAALTLLISRYLARERFTKRMKAYPKFTVIDRALAKGGWKVVALLRLSPAVPFNLQNYLYGLTGIPFLTCVVTSWIAMLPGTILYVFVGSLAKTATQGTSGAKLALTCVGFAATVVVTVYITKLAKRELARQTKITNAPDTAQSDPLDDAPARTGRLATLTFVALVVLAGGILAQTSRREVENWIISRFGPPHVTLENAYDDRPGDDAFDHSSYDELLHEHVDADGLVDYKSLRNDRGRLETYITALETAPFGKLGRDEKLALLLNAYNAWTLKIVLEHYETMVELEDVRDVLYDAWEDERWTLAGNTWSLSKLEHSEIRPKFNEPRIHFALVCAAVGCPPLRSEAYVGSRIHEQLEAQSRFTHEHRTWFLFDEEAGVLHLTRIYAWYGGTGGDFEQVAGSDLAFASRWSEPLRGALAEDRPPTIEYLDYSWLLNDQGSARARGTVER